MEQTLEHRIRQRAYEIWHAHGQMDGKADEHWFAAEREVLSTATVPAVAACDTEITSTSQKRNRGKTAKASKPTRANA